MFSNGTLPYERSHVNSLNEENLTFGLFPSKSPRAPIQSWFGATLDSDRREYISDVTGKVIKTDDQQFSIPIIDWTWMLDILYFNGDGQSLWDQYTQREIEDESNIIDQ